MPLWLQNLIVLLIVVACCWTVARQFYLALRGKSSSIGSCCAKGCSAYAPKPDAAAPIHFLPADSLRRRK
jgi:hypothetical protein